MILIFCEMVVTKMVMDIIVIETVSYSDDSVVVSRESDVDLNGAELTVFCF